MVHNLFDFGFTTQLKSSLKQNHLLEHLGNHFFIRNVIIIISQHYQHKKRNNSLFATKTLSRTHLIRGISGLKINFFVREPAGD